MIDTAVVCPHPPLLLRELCGAVDTVPDLRVACRQALGTALANRPDAVVVVGGDETTGEWDASLPIGVRRFGTTAAPEAQGLPQSLGIGKRLLEEAGWSGAVEMHTVAWDAGRDAAAEVAARAVGVEGRVVLLVLADGSARRGQRAPGHLDERAFAFDDELLDALEAADVDALSRVDPGLAEELMARGRAALAVLAEVVAAQGAAPRAEVLYRDDPHGVTYAVALWQLSQGPGAVSAAG